MSDDEKAAYWKQGEEFQQYWDEHPTSAIGPAHAGFLTGLYVGIRAGREQERKECAKMVLEFPGFDPDRGIREQMAAAIRKPLFQEDKILYAEKEM